MGRSHGGMAQGQREAETFQRDGGGGAVQAGTVYAGGCGRGSYPRLYGRLQRQQGLLKAALQGSHSQ